MNNHHHDGHRNEGSGKGQEQYVEMRRAGKQEGRSAKSPPGSPAKADG